LQAHESDVLGAPPYNNESALPYLFKVLSIAKALSVQVAGWQRSPLISSSCGLLGFIL
jgi:hypothetical protein